MRLMMNMNLNNNLLPKMNLNMLYYYPIQQQNIPIIGNNKKVTK